MTHRAQEASGDAVQPILDVQHRWVEALLKADPAALDMILASSYVDTDESGCRFDKAGILAALKSGDLKLTSIHTVGDACGSVWQLGSIDRRFRADGSFPGQSHRTEDTFHRHPGFAKREVESGRSTPNRRSRSVK